MTDLIAPIINGEADFTVGSRFVKNSKSEFYKMHFDAEIVGEAARELGETKTLVLLFERYYLRTESHASLIEENFAKWGEEALRNLGFWVKVR